MNAKFWPQSGIFVLHSKGPKYAEMLADGSVHRSSVDPNCDVGQPMSRARNWRAEALAEGWRCSPSDYHRGSAAGRATRVRARTGEKRRVHRAKHRPRFKASGFACSIPTIADSDSNRLRTGIPIDRGQHSDDCGQELPSTASWVHMTRVRVKLATVGSVFLASGGKAPSP